MPALLRTRSPRRRRSTLPVLESLDARIVLSAITVTSLTETDFQNLSISYNVTPTDLSSVTVNLYRAATNVLNPASAESIGTATLSGSPGAHTNVPIPVTTPLPNGALPLSPDPSHPYVFAAITGPDTETSSASFQKIVVGVVTHGYNIPGETSLPAWVTEMATAMSSEGYQYVIPFDWVAQSELLEPNQATDAGMRVAQQIQTYLAAPGNIPAGAVVDLHFVGHSRGTVVINQAFTTLQQNLPANSPARSGYWRETLLDPHPANSKNQAPFSVRPDDVGQAALVAGNIVQEADQDPLPINVPSMVSETQVYHEHSPTSYAPYFSEGEQIISPNGLAPGDGVNVAPGSKTIINGLDLTTPGIVHSGVWEWYLVNVIPQLGTATDFINGPVDAPIYVTAYNRSAYVDLPFLPLIGNVQTDNPNSVSSDLSATIDWGDGTSSVGTVLGTALTGFAITSDHEYGKAGTYTTTVTVKDVGGSISVSHGTINVSSWTTTVVGSAPGSPALVTVRNDQTGETLQSFAPYDSSVTSGVQVVTADVDGDGTDDFITSAGPGRVAQPVKIFSGKDLHLIGSFFPFGARYRGPLTVSSGDIDADGHADILVSRGPVVRIYDGSTFAPVGALPVHLGSPAAGSTLSATDVNHDGFADIVVRRRNGTLRSLDGHTLTHHRTARELARFQRTLARQILKGTRH